MVVYTFNLSTGKAEAEGSLSSRLPGLQSKFYDDSQGYTKKLRLREKQKERKKLHVKQPKPFSWRLSNLSELSPSHLCLKTQGWGGGWGVEGFVSTVSFEV